MRELGITFPIRFVSQTVLLLVLLHCSHVFVAYPAHLWIENSPEFPNMMSKICATGMNALELGFNDQLTGGFKQKDLNVDPSLPYDDASFDVVTCVVSIGK